MKYGIQIFDFTGEKIGEIPCKNITEYVNKLNYLERQEDTQNSYKMIKY